jgi:PAS domain S-box-containing protein
MWLLPAVIANLLGSLVLAFAFTYLYRREGQVCLRWWALSWCIYSFRFVFQILVESGLQSPWLTIAIQLAALWSGLFLLYGTYAFMGRPIHPFWIYATTVSSAWIFLAVGMKLPVLLLTLPGFSLLGAAYVYCGIKILQEKQFPSLGRSIVGWTFIVWGVHKIDLPWVSHLTWLLPFGYLLASVLELTVAIGILILYFEQARHDLSQRENRLKAIFDNTTVGIAVIDASGSLVQMNQPFLQLFGYPEDNLGSLDYTQLIHPEELNRVQTDLSQLARGELGSYFVDRHLLRRDGSTFWGHVSVSPVQGTNELPQAILMLVDITERKRSELELFEKEERFRLLYEAAPLGYQSLDENGSIVEINQAWMDEMGFNRDEVIGRSFCDFILPTQRAQFVGCFNRFKLEGKIQAYELDLVRKNGSIAHFSFEGKIGRNSNMDIGQIKCIMHDISACKQAQTALN